MKKWGTAESFRAEALARWMCQGGTWEALGLTGPEGKKKKALKEEIKRRMRWYRK